MTEKPERVTTFNTAALAFFVVVQVGLCVLKKANPNDDTVVYAAGDTLNEVAAGDIQTTVAAVGDKGGSGRGKVGMKKIYPGFFCGEYNVSGMSTGDYMLFLVADPVPCREDIFIFKIALVGVRFLTDLVDIEGISICGCVRNTGDRGVAEAEEIIKKLQE